MVLEDQAGRKGMSNIRILRVLSGGYEQNVRIVEYNVSVMIIN